jgi:hypothetical protein
LHDVQHSAGSDADLEVERLEAAVGGPDGSEAAASDDVAPRIQPESGTGGGPGEPRRLPRRQVLGLHGFRLRFVQHAPLRDIGNRVPEKKSAVTARISRPRRLWVVL